MAKPIPRSGYIEAWILIQQNTTGNLQMISTYSSTLGLGFYLTEKDAQHAQSIELLKGNKVNVFLIEWPLNTLGEIK